MGIIIIIITECIAAGRLLDIINAQQQVLTRMWRNQNPQIASQNVKWYSPFGKQSGSSLKKQRVNVLLSSSTPRHRVKRNETHVHEKTCT